VEGVTYLQANLKEVAAMLGRPEDFPRLDELLSFGQSALDLGVKVVFLTSGKEGVMVLAADGARRVGSPEVGRVVDTTGCGDIFCAGTAAMLASGRDPVESAAFGAELASEAAGAAGVEKTYGLLKNRIYSA
jgi:sugar/nucleoside kinase (ribokinase family)